MKVGIIGAGTMGSGIAQAFVVCDGFEVVLCDIKEEYAAGGKVRIEKNLSKMVAKGKMTEEKQQEILSRVTTGLNQAVADCDVVIEAALEQMELKQKVFSELNQICKPETIFASNTSSISVTGLSVLAGRPVVGMHFFNPAYIMKLVEVVEGLNVPKENVETIIKLAESIGKTPVHVKDGAGFAVNRILIPMINEAAAVYADGMASAEDIDKALMLGANHPLGPLALGDLVGLDVCLAIMEVLHAEMGDKYRPTPLLRTMVRAGLLGRKTGRGFFDYSA